ncbi:MAG TPA: hypothetical protein VFW76_12570 [Ktedonobacterales bacterium]|nr:hypothetical protein [Ktedonobacterales bacterium]
MRLHSSTHACRSLTLRRYHLLLAALVALLGASLLTLANAPRALACPVCISPDKITLSGDGVTGTASVTDPGVLAWFSTAQFMGFEQRSPIEAPVHTGPGVELTRFYNNSGVPASFWTQGFDRMRYYPGVSGQPGFIYYEGPVSDEARTFAQDVNLWQRTGKWYALTSAEQDKMGQLLAAAHGAPQNSSAASPQSTSPGAKASAPPGILSALASVPLAVATLLACLALLGVGAGYRLLYIRRHPRTFSPMAETDD